MPIPSRPGRGLQDIGTHAGRVRQAAIPHKAFMRQSGLAMEKFRRARERASAMNRVRNTDSHLAENIVDAVRELRRIGASNHRPTIRACIAIARILAIRNGRARRNDAMS